MTFDKIEWYDICRKLHPGLMWDDYRGHLAGLS